MSAQKRRSNAAFAVGAVALVAALAVGFGLLIRNAQKLPDGPVDVVWDKEACAHCHMHVGEPAYAAQLQLQDGQVLNFDDPGCLMKWLKANPDAQVHATYFHHVKEDRWVPRAKVGFVAASPTPMGYGLGAVDAGTPGAMTYEQAEAQVLARADRHGEMTWR